MEYEETLICEKKEHVAALTINRPDVLNAINLPTINELLDLLPKLRKDPGVRVVTLTGAGEKSFVVGADQKELKLQTVDEKRAHAFETGGREVCNMIDKLGKPTVCAMNGFAFGMGLQMALACTFRFMSSNARMGLPEINMGFFPSMGATQRLTHLIGEAKAIEMIVGGEPIDANEAYRLGLANRLVPPADLRRVVEEFAVKLSEKSPLAVKLAIDAIRHEKITSIEEGLAYEARLSDECTKDDDSKEAMRAFFEKRKPVFKDR